MRRHHLQHQGQRHLPDQVPPGHEALSEDGAQPRGAYTVRQQRVRCGGGEPDVLVAVFPLSTGGAVCLQLQDQGALRRGGVYLLDEDRPDLPALTPRFDELFAAASVKLKARPDLAPRVDALLGAASELARRCLPRLTPEALDDVRAFGAEAAALDADAQGEPPWESLLLCLLLIFVSEEERYPRPRYKGSQLTLGRIREVLPEAP